MTHSLLRTTPNAGFILPLFLFVVSGLAIIPIVVSSVHESPQKPSFVIAPTAQKAIVLVPRAVQEIPQAHLKIPKIGVDAVIKEMGMTSEGAMAVPSNSIDVGWFSPGTRPGETGSAVIGAHSLWNSEAGVFAHLDQLQKGDVVSVVDAKGVATSFVVRDIRTYDAADTDTGIFESENGVHLNLITCSGQWDPATQTYTTRLVVFTDVVQTSNAVAIVPTQKPFADAI